MILKPLALAAVLATAASPALAAEFGPIPLTTSASFANTVQGAFTDIWTFNLSTQAALAASVTNVEITFAGGAPAGGILGFGATLNGTPLRFGESSQAQDSITFKTQVLAGASTLPAGLIQLTVSGTGITGASASYGGNIVATPVPEPETYALMLAGLGVIGYVASRRRRGG